MYLTQEKLRENTGNFILAGMWPPWWMSQDHGDFFVQRTGLIDAWQTILVPLCEYWNFISPLSTDLPTLKRLINTLPLKGLAQSQ